MRFFIALSFLVALFSTALACTTGDCETKTVCLKCGIAGGCDETKIECVPSSCEETEDCPGIMACSSDHRCVAACL